VYWVYVYCVLGYTCTLCTGYTCTVYSGIRVLCVLGIRVLCVLGIRVLRVLGIRVLSVLCTWVYVYSVYCVLGYTCATSTLALFQHLQGFGHLNSTVVLGST
jgi:hypothetical protein